MQSLFFFNDTAPTEIYTLSLHDALPISAFVAADDQDIYYRQIKETTRITPQSCELHLNKAEIGRAHV